MSTTEHTKTCSSNGLACKLSGPELQKRKATVITLLKSKVQEKHELENGYAYSFIGTDDLLTELVEFVKTERQCCGFLDFNLSIKGDGSTIWLSLTGTAGAKEFIANEIEF